MTATVAVRPPEAADWQNVDTLLPGTPYMVVPDQGWRVWLPIELLVPGRVYTLTLDAVGLDNGQGGRVQAVVDGQLRELVDGVRTVVSWTFTPARPVRLDVSGIRQLNVHALTLVSYVPDHQLRRAELPGDVLALDLMVQRPGATAFVLDSSRLDRDALTVGTPWPGTFVLGTSKLGAAYLDQPSLTQWWRPALGKARAITTRRGTTTGVVPVGQVGTLAAEFPDALDPRALALHQGTPVRLYHWPSRRMLFAGKLTRAQLQPVKPGGRLRYVTTIEAADAVAELAATTRHGAIGVESWRNRLDRLMDTAPGIAYRVADVETEAAPTMGNTVLTSSLAKHLDVLAASARGAWWVDADGTVVVCPGTPAGPVVATFTDRRRAADAAPWGYVDAAAGWDWQAVVSVVELNNYGAAWDAEQGAWAEDNTTTTATNVTLAATYGTQTAQVETNLADPAEAAALAAQLARGQDGVAEVTSVRLDALPAMDRAAALDLFALVDTELRGERGQALLAELAHTITPTAWTTTAALQERTTP